MGLARLAMALKLVRQAWDRWNDHAAPRLGAALAFYALLSLAPLLTFLVTILSKLFGKQHVEEAIAAGAAMLVGKIGVTTVGLLAANAGKPTRGVTPGLLAVFVLLAGASSVFIELRDSLNTIWEVKPAPESFRQILIRRFFSFLLVLAVGALLVTLMLITAALSFMGGILAIPAVPFGLLQAGSFVLSIAVAGALFASVFRFVPDRALPRRAIVRGALVTAVLFAVGKELLGIYLRWSNVGYAYGAAGSVVIVLVWTYYAALIFLFGAELTYVSRLQ